MSRPTHFDLQSPIGILQLEETDGQLMACRWHDGEFNSKMRPTGLLAKIAVELQEYFAGERQSFSFEVPPSQNFQGQVWSQLQKIPYGEVVTYKEIAERVGRPGAARAVGQACHRNPWLILVPCHRVIAANAKVGGFALDLELKRWLLSHERSNLNPELPLADKFGREGESHATQVQVSRHPVVR